MRLLGVAVAGLAIASSTTSTSTSTSLDRSGSTITSRDYVGPARCGECHADEHARWSQSLHRVMNARVADPGAVIGDFTGATIAYDGGTARFSRDGDAYTMTLAKRGREVRYRVTRTIGRRGLQEYVGVGDDGVEVRLPFGWWPRYGGWAPQAAFDAWLDGSFDAYAPVHEPWAERCPWCHSTYPFEQRIARASGERRTGHGLEQFFVAAPAGDRLDVAAQVTTGISCESCHLGGRDHVAGGPSPLVPRGAEPRPGAPVATRFADERRDPTIVNGTCAQCHSGPSPRLADGTSLRNSSESLDLGRAPCSGITCIDCHDPHRADTRAADTDTRAVAACVRCHDRFADPATAKVHAGHDAVGCLDCHMPRVVMGIDRYVRTHRISSPHQTPEINACNLCHLDRSFDWARATLADRFGVRAGMSGVHEAGRAWLDSKHPAIRLIAAAAYARSPLGVDERSRITAGLVDPLPYVRAWTRFALDSLENRSMDR